MRVVVVTKTPNARSKPLDIRVAVSIVTPKSRRDQPESFYHDAHASRMASSAAYSEGADWSPCWLRRPGSEQGRGRAVEEPMYRPGPRAHPRGGNIGSWGRGLKRTSDDLGL